MNIITLAFDLARLKGHAMTDYRFPFWHAALLLTLIGLSAGLDHTMGVPMPWSFAAELALCPALVMNVSAQAGIAGNDTAQLLVGFAWRP